MSKTEILEELPKLTKLERREIRLRLAELDSKDWLDDKALLPSTKKRYSKRASPLTPWIQTPVAHGKKLRAESEPDLVFSRMDDQSLILEIRSGGRPH
jgi:hypothetical protein